MVYAALVFGILGLIGFLQSFELKKRIDSMERELTKMEGTSYRKERLSLLEAAAGYVGKKVTLDLIAQARAVRIPEMVRLMKRTVPEFKSKNSRFELYDRELAAEKK